MTALPPGTPYGEHTAGQLAAVWCTHGVRFDPEPGGYRPVETDELHPDLLCRDYGAIPAMCQPATPHPPTTGGAVVAPR